VNGAATTAATIAARKSLRKFHLPKSGAARGRGASERPYVSRETFLR
jgi:hypothetical protein